MSNSPATNPLPPSSSVRAPAGIYVIALILTLTASLICFARISELDRAYSSGITVVIRPSYYVKLVRDAIVAGTALLAAIGLSKPRPWGWYLTIYHYDWLTARAALNCLGHFLLSRTDVNHVGLENAQRQLFSVSVFAAIIIYYITRPKIMSYCGVVGVHFLRTNAILIGLSFPVAYGLEMLGGALQQYFPS
jgi:hypothetical protein